MIFGLSGFGVSAFNNGVPFDTTIESVQLSNSIVDEIKIDANLDVEDSITKEDWSTDTMLLAEFQNNLEGGILTNGGIPVQKLRIKRRLSDSLTWETMTELDYDDSITNYVVEDFFIKNSKTYFYKIVPVTQNLEGNGSQASIQASYMGTFITGMLNGALYNYPLRFDLEISDITLNEDKTFVKTLSSQYPAVLGGKAKYKSGTLSATLISASTEATFGDIDIDAENNFRESFETFLENQMPKLIRTHSFYKLGVLGEIKANPFSNDCAFGLWKYSFNFTEIASTDIATLIKLGLEYNLSTS